jgi:hypothetical protein
MTTTVTDVRGGPVLDATDRALMEAFRRYLDHANDLAAAQTQGELTALGERIAAHLGVDPRTLPVVTEDIGDHRLVDADIALDELAHGDPAALLGVAGDDGRFHSSASEIIAAPSSRWTPGPVSYAARATGPDETRRVVTFGFRLLVVDLVSAFLQRLRALMVERSVLRGQVLSFERTEYGAEAGATFVRRPVVTEDDIVLPEGLLDDVTDHVVGIGEQREALLAAGQHLKRGVLLYGPPGTGKTLTVRHLLTRTPGTTAVLLTGSSIAAIGAAAEIARTFQPSIVVLEDIDLVAMERHSSPQPLLFEVLDALDGLDGDADVAFVMTTNRVSVLERALADRPGRVDLAVEVPLPGLPERVRLFRRYAGSLPFSDDAVTAAATRAEGTTGSFAKELMRRSVLGAALRGAEPGDDDLATALESLLAARSELTRKLLGSRGNSSDDDSDDPDEDGEEITFSGSWVPVGPTAHFPQGHGSTLAMGFQQDDDEEEEDTRD